MRRSHNITMQGYGTVIGWTGIVVVLLADSVAQRAVSARTA